LLQVKTQYEEDKAEEASWTDLGACIVLGVLRLYQFYEENLRKPQENLRKPSGKPQETCGKPKEN
jgi:hypothetical protein